MTANAPKDPNGRSGMVGVDSTDPTKTVAITVNPATGAIQVKQA